MIEPKLVICGWTLATRLMLFVGDIWLATKFMFELLLAVVLTAELIPATVVKLALSEVDNQVFSK